MEKELKLPIRTIIILIFIVLALLTISIYTSLAAFKKTVEKEEVVTIKVKDISPTITTEDENFEINEDGKSGVVTVLPDEEYFFDLTLTNNEKINVKYELYYNSNIDEKVEVGVTEEISDDTLIAGENNKIKVGVRNLGIDKSTVTIGVQGGYENNNIDLKDGRTNLSIIDESYKDNTGANEPKLAEGMIPVKYDETIDAWVKADRTEEWYDYEKQEWANAVTVATNASTCESDCIDKIPKKSRNDYRLAEVGTPISMDDINSMWVWIPRYKYRIPESIGISTDTPPKIDVVFENGTEATGLKESEYRKAITTDGTVPEGIYYTHPAFRDGTKVKNEADYDLSGWDHELTGIWVGKFETGGTNTEPIIKPNVESLGGQTISNQFITSLKISNGTFNQETGETKYEINSENKYGLNTTNNSTNTRMMKSTEWGMVTYLYHSKYGKIGNDNFDDKIVYSNDSSGVYTGRGQGFSPWKLQNTVSGTYSYDDHLCLEGNTTICTGDKEKYKGTGASTTGSIYGVYDMAGGKEEYIMGNFDGILSNSGFINLPSKKYYDSIYKNINDNLLGTAIWETRGWYQDTESLIHNWDSRGGHYFEPGGVTGIFYIFFDSGHGMFHYSFRTVLIS